jgi:putative hydrolase of the HAD superfamily
MSMTRIEGVLFDIGGVVQDSPLHAIARFEREHGLPAGAINRTVVETGEDGAWSRLERGELTLSAFCASFEAECRARGVALSASRMMAAIAGAGVLRPQMLEAIRRIRAHGLRVGALTNNWVAEGGVPRPHKLREHFDVVIESAVVGLRKPDPRIYELACRELGVAPARTAFLDDIGRNLQAARALGLTTIKVDDPERALAELGAVLGLALTGTEPGTHPVQEETMSVVRRFEAAFNGQDVGALVACFTEDGTYVDNFFGPHAGGAELTAMFARMFREGRDYRWTMDTVVETAERAAAEWTFGYVVTDVIPRSAGRRVGFRGMSLFELRDGRIAAYRECFDTGVALLQLGFSPDSLAKVLRRRLPD